MFPITLSLLFPNAICANDGAYRSSRAHKIYRKFIRKVQSDESSHDSTCSRKDKRERRHMHLHVAQMEFLLRAVLSSQLPSNAIALFLFVVFEPPASLKE